MRLLRAGAIEVVTLGPLTNVALAIRMDPNFVKNVKKFYAMGGTVSDLASDPEFNFEQDPESDRIFLSSVTAEKTVISPWDMNNTVSKVNFRSCLKIKICKIMNH